MRDLANLDQAKYSATKHVGKVGIEKVYESSLHGSMGIQRVETDAHGRVRQVLDRLPQNMVQTWTCIWTSPCRLQRLEL